MKMRYSIRAVISIVAAMLLPLVVYAQIEWDMLLQIGDYFAVRHMPLSLLLIRVSEGSVCLV